MLILQNNKSGKSILRQAALFVLVHFFLSTLAMGQGFLEPIYVPSGLGSIQSYQSPQASSADAPLIVHIQDVHALPEAQEKIEKIIRLLHRKYGFSLLLLEGAQTRLDPNLFRFFSDPRRNLKMADYLVENGELSGQERFLIREEMTDSERNKVRAEGIEDENLYRDNMAAFKKVFSASEESGWFLRKMESRVQKLATRVWPAPLRRFARAWKSFHCGGMDFFAFLKILRRTARNELNLDLRDPKNQLDYPHLVRIFTLDAMNPALDAEKFLEEKKEILRYFREARLNRELILDFDRRVRAGRGVLRQGEDLRRLFEEIYRGLPADFSFKRYPQIAFWGGALILREELRSPEIAAEAEAVTERIFNREAQDAEKEKLFTLWRDLLLLRRLFTLELVREEYLDLLDRRESVGPVGILKRIKQFEEGARGFDFPENDLKEAEIEKIFYRAIEFYRGAERRDKKMGENIFRAMQAAGKNRAIVVTGGFHAEGLQKAIQAGGASYVQISPMLKKDMNNRPNYLRSILGNAAGENHLKNPAYLIPRQAQMNLGANLAERDAWIDLAYQQAAGQAQAASLGEADGARIQSVLSRYFENMRALSRAPDGRNLSREPFEYGEYFFPSNEKGIVSPYVRSRLNGLSGALIGTSVEQNFALAVNMKRTDAIYLVDRNPFVTALLIPLILTVGVLSEDGNQFLEFFNSSNGAELRKLAEQHILPHFSSESRPRAREVLRQSFEAGFPALKKRVRALFELEAGDRAEDGQYHGWLLNQEHFKIWRGLVTGGKIFGITADWRSPQTWDNLGKRLKERGETAALVYPSNMSEVVPFRFQNAVFNRTFRVILGTLPLDESALMIWPKEGNFSGQKVMLIGASNGILDGSLDSFLIRGIFSGHADEPVLEELVRDTLGLADGLSVNSQARMIFWLFFSDHLNGLVERFGENYYLGPREARQLTGAMREQALTLAASLGSEQGPELADRALHVLPEDDRKRIDALLRFEVLFQRLGRMDETGLENLNAHQDWAAFDNIAGKKVLEFFQELKAGKADFSSFNAGWEEPTLRFLGREHELFRGVKLTPQFAFRAGYESFLRAAPADDKSPFGQVARLMDFLMTGEGEKLERFSRASLVLQEWGMIDLVSWVTGALDRLALYAERRDGSKEAETAREFLSFFVSGLFESAAMTHAFIFNRSIVDGFLRPDEEETKNTGVVYLLSGSTHLYQQALEIAGASGADTSRLHAVYVNRKILEGDEGLLREYLAGQGIPNYDRLVIVDTGFHGTVIRKLTDTLTAMAPREKQIHGRLLAMSEAPYVHGPADVMGFNHVLEAIGFLPDDKNKAAFNFITHLLDTVFPALERSPVRLEREPASGEVRPVLAPSEVSVFAEIVRDEMRKWTQGLIRRSFTYPQADHAVWGAWLAGESLGSADDLWQRSKFLKPHPEITFEDIARAGSLLRQSRAAAGEAGLSDIAQGIFPAPLIHSDKLDGMMHDLTRLEKKYYLLYLPYLPEGSFKPYVTADVLDHFDRLFRTDPARLKQIRRIVAESTGNQGKAVAAAVNKLKALYAEHAEQLQAVIFVPFAANPEKVRAIQDLGATVIRHKFTEQELEEYLKAPRSVRAEMELRAENESRILKDYTEASSRVDEDLAAHPETVYYIRHGSRMGIAGYANIGFEALDQWFRYVAPELGLSRHIVSSADIEEFRQFVRAQPIFRRVAISGPAGSGGLESGLVQVKQLNPLINVFGTQVPGVDPLFVSLTQDQMVNKEDFVFDQEAVRHVDGIAATPERLTFEILRQMLDGLTRVPYQDNDLMTRLVWGLNLEYSDRSGRHLLEIEPASVLPLTNMVYHGDLVKAEHVIVPVTGRVTDRDLKQGILSIPYRDAYQIIKSRGRGVSGASLGQEHLFLPITLMFRVRHWVDQGKLLLDDSRHLQPDTVRQVQGTFAAAAGNNEFDHVYFNLLKAWLFVSHGRENSYFSQVQGFGQDELRQRYEDFEREIQQLLIDVLIYRDGHLADVREWSGHLKPIDNPSKVLAVLGARRLQKSELILPGEADDSLGLLISTLAAFPSGLTYGEVLPGILSREFAGIQSGFDKFLGTVVPFYKEKDKPEEAAAAREERHALILNHGLLMDQNLYLFARDLAGQYDYSLSASVVDDSLAAAIELVKTHPQLTDMTNHFYRYRAYLHSHNVYRSAPFAQAAAFAFLDQLSKDIARDIRGITAAEVEESLEAAVIGPQGRLTRTLEGVNDMKERVRPKKEGPYAASLGTEASADERIVKLEQLLEEDKAIRKKAWALISKARHLNRKLESRVLYSAINSWVAELQQSGHLSALALNDFNQAVNVTRGWAYLRARQSETLRSFREIVKEIRTDKERLRNLLESVEKISAGRPVFVSFEGLARKEIRRLIALHTLEITAGLEAVEDDLPRHFVNLYRRLEGFSGDLREWSKKPEKLEREKMLAIAAAITSISEGPRTDPDHGLIAPAIRARLASLAWKLNALTEETALTLVKKQALRVLPPETPQPSTEAVPVSPKEASPHSDAGPVQLEFDFGADKQPEGQSLGAAARQNAEEARVVEDVTRRIARIYPALQREAELIRLGVLVRSGDLDPVQTMPAFARAYFTSGTDFGVAVSRVDSLENIRLLEELMVSQSNKMLIVYVRGPVDRNQIKAKQEEYDKKIQGRIRLITGSEIDGRSYEDFVEGLVRGGKFADLIRRDANHWFRRSGRPGDLTRNHGEFLKYLTVVAGENDFSRLALPFITPFYSKDLGLASGVRDFAETFYAVIGSGISEAARLKRQVGDELDLRLSRDGLKVEGLSLNENSLNHYLELMTAIQSARTVLQQAA